MSHAARYRALMLERFGRPLAQASRQLAKITSGAVLVVGCDSPPFKSEEMGDHGVVAMQGGQIVGYARKIFPAGGDTTGDYLPIVPALDDYSSPYRFVRLPNGATAMLAACYDLFGLTEDETKPGRRSQHIRYLWANKEYHGDDGPIPELRAQAMAAWHALLKSQKPNLALCAIHGFEAPGLDGYWQRHGIATASAMLQGSLIVGAAHFWEVLPQPESSTLSALNVPKSYIELWAKRPMANLKPLKSIYVESGELTA